MNPLAFNYFINKFLKEGLPGVTEIFPNWPPDEEDPSYPFVSVMQVSTRFEDLNMQPQLLGREGENSIYGLSPMVTILQIHYFFQRQIELNDAILAINTLFQADLEGGNVNNVTLKYGPQEWDTAVFRLLSGGDIDTGETSLRKGERRLIFNVEAQTQNTKSIKQPVWKGYAIDAHISERQKT